MRTFVWAAACGLAAIGVLVLSSPLVGQAAPQRVGASQRPAEPARPAEAPRGADAALVARGDYLTHSVAMCVQCHSPRDTEGNVIETQQFHGGAIPFKTPYPNRPFAYQAPSLAGLPGFTDEQVISLLMTGSMGGGRPMPRAPMPPFRMNHDDAAAIVAYLRTR